MPPRRRRPKPIGKRQVHSAVIARARRSLRPTLPKPKKPRVTFIRTSTPKPKKSRPSSPGRVLTSAAKIALKGIRRHFGS